MAAAQAARMALDASARSLAEKQYDNMLKTVSLLNEAPYHKFRKQIRAVASKNRWHPSILDPATAAPAVPTAKEVADTDNAYGLLMKKCDGHAFEAILEGVPIGDAKAAYASLHNFIYPPTQGGKQHDTNAFYNSTMANTGTNIVEWTALVPRNANVLVERGTSCDDDAKLTRLLTGLLPEFNDIKLILEQTPGITFTVAASRLISHATDRNLMDLTKGGAGGGKAKTFVAAGAGKRKPE